MSDPETQSTPFAGGWGRPEQPASELEPNEQMLQKLWTLRERDAAMVAELSARLERFEAAFDACWSALRRVEVRQGDLAQELTDHEMMLAAFADTPYRTAVQLVRARGGQGESASPVSAPVSRPASFEDDFTDDEPPSRPPPQPR